MSKNKEIISQLLDERALLYSISEADVNNLKRLLGKQKIKEIINNADSICNHNIRIFSDEYYMGKHINWNKDYRSGKIWELNYSTDINVIDSKDESDIKNPWELNRFLHSIELGKAFVLTKNDKYTDEFIKELEDWIIENPPKKGINWNCAMEIALRAINLIRAFFYFYGSIKVTEDMKYQFLNMICMHGESIAESLENSGKIRGNHYIADLMGLYIISSVFPFFRKSPKWNKFGLQELKNEIKEQVYDDGTSFENSLPYHNLVTEMFLFVSYFTTLQINTANEKNFLTICTDTLGQDYVDRLEKMCEYIMAYSRADGLTPQIGDGDGGYIFSSEYKTENDHRAILALAGHIFNRNDFKNIGKYGNTTLLWFNKGVVNNTEQKEVMNNFFRNYKNGTQIIRNNDDLTIIKCGGLGTGGKGTHSHNDSLSFELIANGIPYIVDPGTYSYSRDPYLRDLFRSNKYHNTISINELEQNTFISEDPFTLIKQCNSKLLSLEENNNEIMFEGECQYLNEKLNHIRKITYWPLKKMWTIQDNIFGEIKSAIWYFHIHPKIETILNYRDAVLKSYNGKTITISFDPTLFNSSLQAGWYSPTYDKKVKSEILKLEYKNDHSSNCFFFNLQSRGSL